MSPSKNLSLILAAVLGLAPALPLLADDAAPAAVSSAAQAAPAPAAASASAPAAASGTAAASDAPDLPEVKEGEEPAVAPVAVTDTAEPEVPKDVVAVPGKPKPDVVESKYKWSNFALGFFGGAVVGAAAGILFLSKGDDGSFSSDRAKVMAPAVGAGAGLAFGLAALFLGATTPEEAKPPKVESQLQPLPASPVIADLGLRLDVRF